MKLYLWFLILSALTGSPWIAIAVLIAGAWALDQMTWRLLPSPARVWGRWQRRRRLRQELLRNPHDRRARQELADLLVSKGRHPAALEVLRPNLEAGEDGPETLFVFGQACLGAGEVERGEAFLKDVLAQDPDFKQGEPYLVLGRWRVDRGEYPGAIDALEQFVQHRQGTVEGRYLLAKALEGAGRTSDAQRVKDEAWVEYTAAPGYRRRVERTWAWRVRPSRPLTYLALIVVFGLVFSQLVVPAVIRLDEESMPMNEP